MTVAALGKELPSSSYPTERLDRAEQHRQILLRVEAEGQKSHLAADQKFNTDKLVAEGETENSEDDVGEDLEDEGESAVGRQVVDDYERKVVRLNDKGEGRGLTAN